jgi:hypothetical protein
MTLAYWPDRWAGHVFWLVAARALTGGPWLVKPAGIGVPVAGVGLGTACFR